MESVVICPVGQFIACFGRCFSMFIMFSSMFCVRFCPIFFLADHHTSCVSWCSRCLGAALRENCESETKQESVRAKRDKTRWHVFMIAKFAIGTEWICRVVWWSMQTCSHMVHSCSLHFRDTSYRLAGSLKFRLLGKQVPFFLLL